MTNAGKGKIFPNNQQSFYPYDPSDFYRSETTSTNNDLEARLKAARSPSEYDSIWSRYKNG